MTNVVEDLLFKPMFDSVAITKSTLLGESNSGNHNQDTLVEHVNQFLTNQLEAKGVIEIRCNKKVSADGFSIITFTINLIPVLQIGIPIRVGGFTHLRITTVKGTSLDDMYTETFMLNVLPACELITTEKYFVPAKAPMKPYLDIRLGNAVRRYINGESNDSFTFESVFNDVARNISENTALILTLDAIQQHCTCDAPLTAGAFEIVKEDKLLSMYYLAKHLDAESKDAQAKSIAYNLFVNSMLNDTRRNLLTLLNHIKNLKRLEEGILHETN